MLGRRGRKTVSFRVLFRRKWEQTSAGSRQHNLRRTYMLRMLPHMFRRVPLEWGFLSSRGHPRGYFCRGSKFIRAHHWGAGAPTKDLQAARRPNDPVAVKDAQGHALRVGVWEFNGLNAEDSLAKQLVLDVAVAQMNVPTWRLGKCNQRLKPAVCSSS